MGVSQNKGYHSGGPHNKDYNMLGTILGFPYFGNCHVGIHRASCHRFEQICWKMGIGKKLAPERHTTSLRLMGFLG